jgi:Rrf2 family transcriptional regulator, nitric oxide-sensitive transcriptional repressor
MAEVFRKGKQRKMRLTIHTDYALRMLIVLALREGAVVSVGEIADSFGISRHHLIKVAQHLRSGGYVETTRGNGGGLRLAQPAAAINIGVVVRHTESDMHLVTCFAPDGQCRIYNGCFLHSVLHEALEAFFAVLDRYCLADLVASRRLLEELLGMPAPAEMA